MSDVEQRLQAAGAAWRADQPQARTQHPAARRRRNRWLPAAAAAAVVGLALAASTLGGDPRPPGPAGPADGSWTAMAASPLSARLRPVLTGWGDQVVVLGGDPYTRPCPPNAACVRDLREAPRDAALYDVPRDAWERLPDAPLPLDVSSSAVLDDVLYLWLGGEEPAFLSLDLRTRAWATLPVPPVVGGYLHLTATDERVVASYGEMARADVVDQQWDPVAQRWAALPQPPFLPSFDRSMVWTGTELVLIAPTSPETGPPFMRAAVLRGDVWAELPAQETVIFGSTDWSWTGARVVSASTQRADGGQTNGFGRPYPSGGYLDPATGRWAALPPEPADHQREGGLPYAAGGRWVSNGEGLALDTERDRWAVPPAYEEQPDQEAGAAWAAGRLVVWGGAAGVHPAPEPDRSRVLGSGAVWTPPEG